MLVEEGYLHRLGGALGAPPYRAASVSPGRAGKPSVGVDPERPSGSCDQRHVLGQGLRSWARRIFALSLSFLICTLRWCLPGADKGDGGNPNIHAQPSLVLSTILTSLGSRYHHTHFPDGQTEAGSWGPHALPCWASPYQSVHLVTVTSSTAGWCVGGTVPCGGGLSCVSGTGPQGRTASTCWPETWGCPCAGQW